MKKYYLMVFCLMFLLAFSGCSKKMNQNKTGKQETVPYKVASLKGPTSFGLLQMMNQSKDSSEAQYEIFAAADEIVTKVVKGEVDFALVPANVASVLYQKTNQNIRVIDINTLGVLSVVEHGQNIESMQDLKGKTICMTGKGTVPEYVLTYLLEQNGVGKDEVQIEFKSEPTEVVAFLSKTEDAVGILPQPFTTVAMTQDESLRIALSLTEEWSKVDSDTTLITGVTIVRADFLQEHEETVQQFLKDHSKSVQFTNENVEEAATMSESFDLVKAAIAKKAIPDCNIVCITGDAMQQQLSGYLKTLFDANADSIGGTLPDEEFYYNGIQEEK